MQHLESTGPRQLKSFNKRKVSNEMELFELVAQSHVCITHITIK